MIVTRRNELPLLMMLSLSGVNSRVTDEVGVGNKSGLPLGECGAFLAVLGGEKCSVCSVVLHPTIKH